MMNANIVEIYYIIDEFSKNFDKLTEGYRLPADTSKKHRNRAYSISGSEITTIMILFHQSHCRDLKFCYTNHIKNNYRSYFLQTVSYNRFVELQQKALVPMVIFLQICCMGKCTGFSFIDSTPVRVCRIKREHSHKVFKGIAAKGKSTAGLFFGFKLHLVINGKGKIIQFQFSQANVDGREPLKNKQFYEKISGKLFAGRGYVSQSLFDMLFVDNIHLVAKLKKNMKNALMLIHDKTILRKRAIIETINDQLKNICQIEHARHRSFANFISNLISDLVAYNLMPKKTSINLDIIDLDKLKLVA